MVKKYVNLPEVTTTMAQEMKKSRGNLLGVLILFLMMGWNAGWGQSLLVDDFSGTVGTNLTANGWVAHNASGTGPLTIASPGLSYSGYAGTGVGNATSPSGNSEDINKAFTLTNSGSVYCAFMVSTATTVNTTDYCLHFTQSAGTGAAGFFARFFIQKDASNNVRFGVSKGSETAVNTAYSYALNTTYLIVLKYTFNAGATNDGVSLFVNPVPGAVEPAATLNTVTTGTDATGLAAIAIRQFSTATLARFDGIRVGTTWASVTPAGISISSTGTPASLSTTYGTASGTTNFSVSASGLTAATGITITPPAGFEVATTSDFSTTIGTNASPLNVGGTGTVSSTTIYLRLAAGIAAGNYTGNIVLSSDGALNVNVATDATNTVNTIALTISGLSVVEKTFDNTTTATLSGTPALVGVLTADLADVILGGTPVANFDTPAVGVDKPVTVTGYTLSGSAEPNYTLTQPSLLGTIISSGLADQTITFNALSPVTYGVAPFALTATSDSGLTVSYSSSDENVATIGGSTITIVGAGTVTITASQAGNGSFNPATSVNQSLTVNQKELTVSGAIASDLVYNADTTTSITGGSLVGVINSDDVSFTGTGNFEDANVGEDKTVNGNLSLTGTKAGNYFLTQPILTADITPKELTITGISIENKEYDTTDSATILGVASLNGLEFADAFSVSLGGSPVATFDSASVGSDKPVTVSGYTFSGSINYFLTQPSGLTADITLRTINIIDLTADNKEYDRTTAATLSGTPALSGVLPGDEANVSLAGSPTANFLTATAGTNKTVSVTGYSLSGTSLANYILGTLNLTADITKKDVSISDAAVADKDYDGTTTASLTGTLDGVIAPDVVTLNLSAVFADALVGTDKEVTSTSTITGADATNYNLVQPTGLTASISASPCVGGTSGLVTWDFGTSAALTAAPASNTTTGLTISNVSNNNNLGGSATLLSTTSASSTYPGFSANGNAGAAAISGALNTATSTYFEFTVTPTNGNTVSLTGISFGSRRTGTGPLSYALRSSLDNYATNINTAAGVFANNTSWALHTPAITATAASSAPVVFRLYGYDGTATAPNTVTWRIDDLKLNLAVALGSALSSAATASTCTESEFNYTPTTSFSGATITWTRAAVAGITNAAVITPQTGTIAETLVNTTDAPIAVIYSFTVTGSTCFATQDITVTVNPLPTVTAANVSGCTGTAITLSGSPVGGTFSVANPYTGADTTYTYTYTDANGCTNTSDVATITNTAEPLWYLDADGDQYYTGTSITSCTTPGAGYTTSVLGGNDCNDTNDDIYPGAPEVCWNGILENCTGVLSQGCAAVPVNMTASYNNTTLVSLATAIPAVAYSYGGFTNIKYRFSITNTTTGVTAPDVIQTSRYVTIPAAIHTHGASYTITASAVINEEIVPFAGNTITVNSPSVPVITLSSSSCGATLATLASSLTANPGLNATGYTFRIRLNDSNPSPTYGFSPSATRFVGANTFTGFPLQYGSSYRVAVQYTFTDPVSGLPVDSGYGAECVVNTPSIPVTSMASPSCGGTVSALNANMAARAASYATGYRFRIRLFSDNGPTPTYYETAVLPSRFSSLTAFQGITIAYSTEYAISVQYSVLNGMTTEWSAFGPDCKVTTPFFPTTSLVPSQCGLPTATSLTQQLNITPYPGFPNYKVLLEEVDGETVVTSEEREIVYSNFKLSDFAIAQLGKNYNVSVAIKLNGVFGDYSTACDLFTEEAAPSKAVVQSPFTATAYPNPFANNFMLDVKTSSQSSISVKVYDMVGRLIEQKEVSVSDMESTTIGNQYPSGVYNVVVAQEDTIQTVRVVKR